MAKIKNTDHTEVLVGCTKTKRSYTANGNVKWYNCLGKLFGNFLKKTYTFQIIYHFPARYVSKKNERTHLYHDL